MSLLFRRRPEMRARSFLLDRLLLLQRGGFGLGHLGLLAQLQLPFVGRHELLHPEIGTVEHEDRADRKSTRLNSSHSQISYAVFCLKKKNRNNPACTVP